MACDSVMQAADRRRIAGALPSGRSGKPQAAAARGVGQRLGQGRDALAGLALEPGAQARDRETGAQLEREQVERVLALDPGGEGVAGALLALGGEIRRLGDLRAAAGERALPALLAREALAHVLEPGVDLGGARRFEAADGEQQRAAESGQG